MAGGQGDLPGEPDPMTCRDCNDTQATPTITGDYGPCPTCSGCDLCFEGWIESDRPDGSIERVPCGCPSGLRVIALEYLDYLSALGEE